VTNGSARPAKLYPRLVTADLPDPRDRILDAEVAAMPMAFGTAENLLNRARVEQGCRVLVVFSGHPAGHAALRLSVIRGAQVSAICAKGDLARVRGTGAKPVTAEDLAPQPSFDAVIDLVGGHTWRGKLDLLAPGGHYATTRALADPVMPGERREVFLNDVTRFDRPYWTRELFAGLVTVVTMPRLRLLQANAR